MDPKVKRVKVDEPTSSASGPHKTDWTICVLCQKQSSEPLRNPCKSDIEGKSYATLAQNLKDLNELNSLPLQINLDRLDDGTGIEETLLRHKAQYHKTCYVNCNREKVERIQKKLAKSDQDQAEKESPLKAKLRGAFRASDESQSTGRCFFCDKALGDKFHTAATSKLDHNVRQMATDLRDSRLLAKLSPGDMTATDAVYHKQCLTELLTRHRSLKRQRESTGSDEMMNPDAIAFAELVAYVEDVREAGERPTLKLSDLAALYKSRMEQLGSNPEKRVNSTRLKEKLLAQIPGLEAHSTKYHVVISFSESTGSTLLEASQRDHDKDAVILMRAAQIVRKDIFQTKHRFQGSLLDDSYNDTPASLTTLVQMILAGTSIENQAEAGKEVGAATDSISQLLTFNAMKRSRKDNPATSVRHNPDRETRLPLYLGLLVHSKTRKRDLVDTLFEHGLSVSYNRVIQISTDLANNVIQQFETDGAVCPTALREGLFTTGNLDNLDHNPSSTTSKSSFHGTAISMTQHPTHNQEGTKRNKVKHAVESSETTKTLKPLPEAYVEVPPARFPTDNPQPKTVSEAAGEKSTSTTYDERHKSWLQKVDTELQKETPDIRDISWSAYHASEQAVCRHPPAITGLLPLFRDNAHSLAMVKHGMDLVAKATELVNNGQVPVLTVDQPLYAIAKKIQWSWPETYGSEKYLVLMGGLHIEMALLSVLGDWLSGSGWVAILTNANVATEGRADVLQKGSSTARSQWAHQVTAAALFCLQSQAYNAYCEASKADNLPVKAFDDWCQQMSTDHPQFLYWMKTLQLELLFLQFMRAQREGDFLEYIESLRKIVPLMFAMDHFHYARWLSVHIQDLDQLQNDCPDLWQELVNGHFVTQKTNNLFSMMAHDHVHEQLNAVVKGDGGIIGITENEPALRRFMVAGPETARVLSEVESRHAATKNSPHHEQTSGTQQRFAKDVLNTVKAFNEMGNPFTETSTDLLAMDTKLIMSEDVVQAIKSASEIGEHQYKTFVDERLQKMTKSFYDTIPKNNLPLFKSGEKKSQTKTKAKLSTLKSDLQLFSRMYISCQSRDGEMDIFFEHENHAWPPSLAESNSMRATNKADLLKCLEPLAPSQGTTPDVDVKVFDGPALIHILDPKHSTKDVKTFRQYADRIFLPYLLKQLHNVSRVDIVWDVYSTNSLKQHTRERRGDGEALRVSDQTRIPRNWKSFLRVSSNKRELFDYLATIIAGTVTPPGKSLVTTKGQSVGTSITIDVSDIQPCSQEEADHRMMLHCAHAYHQGHRRIMVHATDTDVVVLAVSISIQLSSCEIWVAFGHGDKFRHIAAHSIAAVLGTELSQGLPFLHAISGCDTTSNFCGIGKKTAWDIWKSLPDVKQVFSRLSRTPESITEADMEAIERYVVLLYNRTSALSSVNEARKQLFCQGNRKIENIPPSKAALFQHVKRACLQAGHIWGQALIAEPHLPSPSDWGWKLDPEGYWAPFWTTLPEAAKSCRELVKCGCNKRCAGRCQCKKSNLTCTQLCFCAGQCSQ